MGLAEVFGQIGAELAEDLGGDPKRFTGPDRKDDTVAPPRINWNPVAGVLTAARQARSADGQDPIWTMETAVDVEVWGKNLSDAETLLDRFLAVATGLLTRFSIGQQPPQITWNPGGVTARGSVAVLRFALARPVLRDPPRLVTPTTIVAEHGLDGSAEKLTVNVTAPT